jgi:hypothetical protein
MMPENDLYNDQCLMAAITNMSSQISALDPGKAQAAAAEAQALNEQASRNASEASASAAATSEIHTDAQAIIKQLKQMDERLQRIEDKPSGVCCTIA